jgi:uncharacterized membrane protein
MMPNNSFLPMPQTEPDPASSVQKLWRTDLLTWLPIIIGLAVLYMPSLYDLFTGIWSSDEQMHGPIVLGKSQVILHSFAGMVLFLSALMLIIGFHTALQKFESFRQNQA